MTALLDLATRVEAATGTDRALDAEIAVAMQIGVRGLLADDHETLRLTRKSDGCAPGTYWFCCRSGMSLRTAEAYTASLDGAVALVPEGWGWEVRGIGYAHLISPRRSPDDVYAHAASPALALTAACLRAHAHLQGEPA
jgi:hypothetical protein